MSGYFANAYALLIAVNENAIPQYALPYVAKDLAAVQATLKNPERCAYNPDHVRALTGQAATRQAILEGLDWLREQIQKDPSGNATAVIYYTGHGWRDESVLPATFYLIPYDMHTGSIPPRALRAEDFAASIAALNPQRLLVVLDCCHSGGMGVKEADPMPAGFAPAALPAALLMPGSKGVQPIDVPMTSPLALGTGRAVLSSSQGQQPSYIRRDTTMSIFTYHLIEALVGHARPAEGATEVLVSDVMSHVWRRVPESAKLDWGADQQPDYHINGNFPVALLLGGKGLNKGQLAPDPLTPINATSSPITTAIRHIGTGDYAESDVFIGGMQHYGDSVGGDRISVGDISHSTGVAIGRGARVSIGTGIEAQEINRIFEPLVQVVRSAPAEKRDAAAQKVESLKEEATKGKDASDIRIGKLIDGLVELVPGAVGAIISMFATPILGGIAGPVTSFVLEKIQGK